jgi:hypothetical protein
MLLLLSDTLAVGRATRRNWHLNVDGFLVVLLGQAGPKFCPFDQRRPQLTGS